MQQACLQVLKRKSSPEHAARAQVLALRALSITISNLRSFITEEFEGCEL